MLFNSFEHGYQDAMRGRDARSTTSDYVEGYKRAIEQLQQDKNMTAWVAGMIALMLGAALAVGVASMAGAAPV